MCVNHKDFCVYEHYKIYKSLWPLLCTLLPSRLWSGLCRFICFRCLAVRMATMSHMSHKSRHSDGLCGFIWCLEEKGHVRRVKRVQNPHPIDPILVRCGKDSRQWLLWHIVTIIPNILGIIGTTYNQQWFWSLLQWVDFWTRDTDFIRSHDVIWTQWVWIFWPKKKSHICMTCCCGYRVQISLLDNWGTGRISRILSRWTRIQISSRRARNENWRLFQGVTLNLHRTSNS